MEDALRECCARGWQGFKAEWVAEKMKPQDMMRVTVPAKQGPDPALAKIEADRALAAPMPESVRQKLNQLRMA